MQRKQTKIDMVRELGSYAPRRYGWDAAFAVLGGSSLDLPGGERSQLKSLAAWEWLLKWTRDKRTNPDSKRGYGEYPPMDMNPDILAQAIGIRDPAICEVLWAGFSIADVVRACGASRFTVKSVAEKAGIVLRPDLLRRKAVKLYVGGMALGAVCGELRICEDTMRKALREAGIAVRGVEEARKVRMDQVKVEEPEWKREVRRRRLDRAEREAGPGR